MGFAWERVYLYCIRATVIKRGQITKEDPFLKFIPFFHTMTNYFNNGNHIHCHLYNVSHKIPPLNLLLYLTHLFFFKKEWHAQNDTSCFLIKNWKWTYSNGLTYILIKFSLLWISLFDPENQGCSSNLRQCLRIKQIIWCWTIFTYLFFSRKKKKFRSTKENQMCTKKLYSVFKPFAPYFMSLYTKNKPPKKML